jgi:uncharacterized protein (TIGR00369 family)
MATMTAFEPRNPNFRETVRYYRAQQGYLNLIGVELVRVDAGVVEYRVPFRSDLGQQDGFFHGGVTGGIAEGAMGAAAATLVPEGANLVGAEYKVNLLAPASGRYLLARAYVVKPGRTLIVCRADVFAFDDEEPEHPCAIAQGTMAVVLPRTK